MNANRYHVSKNLVRVANDNCVIYSIYNNFTINGDVVDTTGDALFGFKVKVNSNATYCVSSQRARLYMRIREYSSEPTNWENDFIVQSVNDDTHYSVSFTTTSTTKWILVAFYTTTVTTISNIMLNTGSEALPYEPYSSEVWHDIPHYIMGTSTDTITTLPAVVYANDTTAMVGMKGNMEQSGTPTPDNPIQPSECGDRTANLFDYQTMAVSATGYYLDATGQELSGNGWKISDYIPCNGNEFTINKIGGIAPAICLYDANKQFLTGKSYQTGGSGIKIPVTINSTTNAKYIRFSYVTINPSDNLSEIIITEGATAPSEYIPYGYKIPILNGSQTTPVYLGEVSTMRRIQKLVLTGDEDWSEYPNKSFAYQVNFSTGKRWGATKSVCTHYSLAPNTETLFNNNYTMSQDTLYIKNNSMLSLTDFKSNLAEQYVAGTPVTIWYVLAELTTGIVNEPIRKLGDYADTISNITIPTTTGANTIDVDTTLKPSEVSVNYKGWHPVMNGHESESGQWD